jgi:hypothetical protein
LRASRVLAIVVLLDALFLALGHAPLALGIAPLFRPPGQQPPPSGQGGRSMRFLGIGLYFLFALVVYVLGGILIVWGKWLFRLANVSLIILAVIDNLLLIYTRTMPNIFLGRIIPWSTEWFPPGTVQILIGQTILIILCAILLKKTKQTSTSK